MWVGKVGHKFELDYAQYLKDINVHGTNGPDRVMLSLWMILLLTTDDFSQHLRGSHSIKDWNLRLGEKIDKENTEYFYEI